jgi:hypothetical protein
MAYKIFVLPASMKMNPDNIISNTSVKKIIQLVKDGANLVMDAAYKKAFADNGALLQFKSYKEISMAVLGKGKIVLAPYRPSSFSALGVERDMEVAGEDVKPSAIAYTHRKLDSLDIYFISNQDAKGHYMNFSFRAVGEVKLMDPLTGVISNDYTAEEKDGRKYLSLFIPVNGSKVVVFRNAVRQPAQDVGISEGLATSYRMEKSWTLQFDTASGGPAKLIQMEELRDWTRTKDTAIKFYSGTVVYSNSFDAYRVTDNMWLELTDLHDIATVKVNGKDCGTLWVAPYTLNITEAIKKGINTIEIAVTNTWHNRLIADNIFPPDRRRTFTTAPFRLDRKPLLPAGLIGEVRVMAY